MRRNLFLLNLLFSGLIFSQVGIRNNNPEATLDIRAINHNGAVSSMDGVLVPRVNDLETAGVQDGQLVYLIADYGTYFKGFHIL